MPITVRSLLFCVAFAVIVPVLPGTALAWNIQPSQPTSAVFYPGEVQVTVEESLTPEVLPSGGSGFMLVLPPRVAQRTFFISVLSSPAAGGGFFWLDKEEREAALITGGVAAPPSRAILPENETSPERRALLEKFVSLAEEVAQKEGDLAATQTRLELWRKALDVSLRGAAESDDPESGERLGKGKPLSSDFLAELDASLSRHLPGLYLSSDQQKRALEDARQRFAKAEEKLNEYDAKEGCEIVVVPFAGTEKGPQRVRYGYVLPASCSISYRLLAEPDKGALTIAQDVALGQISGFTWDKVDTFVSTLRRDRKLSPGTISPWRIALLSKNLLETKIRRDEELPLGVPYQQSAVNQLPRVAAPSMGGAQPEPYQEERSTFRMWSLGKQRIAHKTPMRLSLATDRHTVRYYYTLRPIANPKGFLTAELALPSALELPPGQAQFFVDGVSVGEQQFSFNGDKGIIFFGSDPQVTATVRNLKRSSGEQGFISKDQTLSWHWQITLKSTRAKPVEALLEDPVPDTFDESVIISADSKPKPEQAVNPPEHGGAKVYRWKATLKPGEPFVVDHKVQAAAPKSNDKELIPGRGGKM